VDTGVDMPSPIPSVWQDAYELGADAPIGGGAFADVYKIRNIRTHRSFAVKVMHRPNFTLRGIERQLDAEIESMMAAANFEDQNDDNGAVEGHHVLRLLNVVEENEYVYLLLELCEEGDLLRRLHIEPRQRFTEAQGALWARQLFLGLQTVHSLGFLHRDIKPDNLLLTDGYNLKIADFGWCCLTQEAPTSLAGTFQYMAPEVLQNAPQDEQVDVWSAGITLYQVLVGRPLLNTPLGPGATQLSESDPHRATAIKQRWLLEEINSICPPPFDRCPEDLSATCWDFIRCVLMPEPQLRITVAQALEHPWLRAVSVAL